MGASSSIVPITSSRKNHQNHENSSSVGILAVTILDFLPQQNQGFSIFDDELTDVQVKLSSQIKCCKVVKHEKESKKVYESNLQIFIINDSKSIERRVLEFEAYDKNIFYRSHVGSGQINIDELLTNKNSEEYECELVEGGKCKGKLLVKISFIPQQHEIISFRFAQALIINNQTLQTFNKKYFVRVEIGEDIQNTKIKSEGRSYLPQWNDEILTFRVPDIIQKGFISLFAIEDGRYSKVGNIEIDMTNTLLKKCRRYSQDIMSNEKIAGTIQFYTSVGPQKQFQQHCKIKKYSFKSKEGQVDGKDRNIVTVKKMNSQNIHLLKTDC